MRELSILGISHIIFGIILISFKRKDKSDYILVAWLAVLLMPFIQQLLISPAGVDTILSRFSNPAFTLLNGPFLYLYIRELSKQNRDRIRYWPHFIVFSIFYILLIINPTPLRPGGPAKESTSPFLFLKYFGVVNILIFILYAFFSLRNLRRHRESIKKTFAWKDGGITLIWLTLLPVFFLILLLTVVFFENSNLRLQVNIEVLHHTIFLLFALYLIFFGLKQKRIFPGNESAQPSKLPKSGTEIRKTEEGEDAILLTRLKITMEDQKLYLNPKLSIYDLALATDISRHRISALLNDGLSMNFFQFVNEYRLEEVCGRMKEDSEIKHNILELAYDSGFNSKSSFNSLFKSAYGKTPSQYRKSLRAKTGKVPDKK